jgi:ABC-type uncharacterized transport system substrate-binding protein
MQPMRRRDFISGLALVAAARSALAQAPARQHRMVFVSTVTPAADMTEVGDPTYRAFFQELRRSGFVEGSNLLVERYSAEGHRERYPDLAREVVSRSPDLIITLGSNPLAIAFREATATIPIVAGMGGDPVSLGITASLARPGGNLTGASVNAGFEIWGKRLQILKELLPSASVVGWLGLRAVWDGPITQPIREAGARLGISVTGMVTEHSSPSEYQRVFAAAAQGRPDAIAVGDGEDQFRHRQLIVELAEKSRLPAMYPYREFVEIGGLMAYATDLAEFGRRLAASAGQILNGAKPGEIPIYQATKFDLVVNLNTARAMGLSVPPSMLARADKVIE